MIAAIVDVVLHPVAGTVRATRRWPARTCHLRALAALVVLGLVSTGGILLYFRVAGYDLHVRANDVRVAYVMPILAGCGLAGVTVLIGGALVRFQTRRQWRRCIDETQYVRLMAAAMWALVPVALVAVAGRAGVGVLLDRPVAALVVLPSGLAVGFFILVRRVVRKLHRSQSGEPACDRCGYLLWGLTHPRCPECGEPFPIDWLTAQPHPAETAS